MELSNQYVSEAESEIYNGMEIRSYLVPKEKIVAHEGQRRMAVNVGLCILPVLALVACIVGSGFEIDDFYDVCESFGAFFMTAVICAIIKICTCKGIFIGKYAKSVPEKIVITFDRLIIDLAEYSIDRCKTGKDIYALATFIYKCKNVTIASNPNTMTKWIGVFKGACENDLPTDNWKPSKVRAVGD